MEFLLTTKQGEQIIGIADTFQICQHNDDGLVYIDGKLMDKADADIVFQICKKYRLQDPEIIDSQVVTIDDNAKPEEVQAAIKATINLKLPKIPDAPGEVLRG